MSPSIKKILLVIYLVGFCVSCKKSGLEKPQRQVKSLPLKNIFQSDFYIGAAINEAQIYEKDTMAIKLLKKEFNSITSENNLKWMYIEPFQNKFNFEVSDKYVALGEKNKMHIVGHTLVWHSQIAEYMKEIKDSTTMAKAMESHIKTVVSRYKDRINSWDVVNEALKEDGTLRESIFYSVLGEGYIEKAFKLTAEIDPNVELTYNDYNLCKPSKREGAINLVKRLQKNGAKIDAVGIQAHWKLNHPSIDEIEKTIIAFSNTGIKVMFTELDVSVLPNPWELNGAGVNQDFKKFEGDPKMNPYPSKLPDSIQLKLAKRYEDIFNLFLKHRDKISRITFWGVNDKQTWLNDWPIKGRTNYPLLFDRKYQKKKAYHSIVNLKK